MTRYLVRLKPRLWIRHQNPIARLLFGPVPTSVRERARRWDSIEAATWEALKWREAGYPSAGVERDTEMREESAWPREGAFSW